jgi:hypothetical protein
VAGACGGAGATKSSNLSAVCARQRAALAILGTPVGLDGAARALRTVIAADRELIDALDAENRPALVAKLRRSEQGATRALASIEQTDPDRSMSPLRTGQASGRRMVGAARALLAAACAD